MLRRIPLLLPILLTCFAYGCSLRPMSDDHAACLHHPLFQELMTTDGDVLQVIITLTGEPADDVARLQDRLLNELEGTEHQVVRRYDNFPILTLQVGEAALCRLVASPLVETIKVDEDVPPTDP